MSLSSLSFSPFDALFEDEASGVMRLQRNRIRRSGGVTPWHCRKSVMDSRRWYDDPSGKVRISSRNGKDAIVLSDDGCVAGSIFMGNVDGRSYKSNQSLG